MGDHFQRIVDVEATEAQAPGLAAVVVEWLVDRGVVRAEVTDCALGDGHAPGPEYAVAVTEPDPGLVDLRTNGLEVAVGRQVFFSADVSQWIACPHCAVDFDSDEAIRTWYLHGTDTHPCPVCGRLVALNDWRWEPPWGFGCLGFTFWNWSPLRDDFVADVAGLLGHRVVRPYGKM
ncbi:hypothetical protein GCM10029964_059340 [Kibdelosporangium lantanae]